MDGFDELRIGGLASSAPPRPLAGVTILLVEDSRFCSEAVRLMCLRSGARLRRADCLKSAHRHLAVFRPAVALVDLGLPDGSGLEIIAEMAALSPNSPVIIATSGGDEGDMEAQSREAGAQAFLPKPIDNITVFQQLILSQLSNDDTVQWLPVRRKSAKIEPDRLALTEDLARAQTLLVKAVSSGDAAILSYCAQFLGSLANLAQDTDLARAADRLAQHSDHSEAGWQLATETLELLGRRLEKETAV